MPRLTPADGRHSGQRHSRTVMSSLIDASRTQQGRTLDQGRTCVERALRGGAAVVLRSKSPPMIRQEVYAILCCYRAIRILISHAAGNAGIDPARISFTRARDAIRSRISDSGCFSP